MRGGVAGSRRAEAMARLRTGIAANAAHLTNAGSMLGTTTVTSVLGAGFWWLAAHGFSQEVVGLATATVAAMTLLGFLATFGLGTLLMGELPRRESGWRSVINAALLAVFALGAVLGLAFAVIAPLLSNAFEPISATPLTAVVFILGVALTALVFVLDEALIGLLRGGLQLSRNTVFATVKFAALIPAIVFLTQSAGPAWIYGAWVAGIVVSFLVLVSFFRERVEADSARPNFGVLRRMRGPAMSHFAFNLGLETANLSLPILVVALISPRAAASFYVAWMVASHLVIVPASLGTVLYPIGSSDPGRMSRGILLTAKISAVVGVLANLILLPVANPLLSIFGAGYAATGTAPLQIMALGIFPLTVKALFVAIHRVERTLKVGLPVIWAGTLLELAGATAGALIDGLTGVAIGWLLATVIQGLVMAPSVIRAIRDPGAAAEDPMTEREVEALDGLAAADVPA